MNPEKLVRFFRVSAARLDELEQTPSSEGNRGSLGYNLLVFAPRILSTFSLCKVYGPGGLAKSFGISLTFRLEENVPQRFMFPKASY